MANIKIEELNKLLKKTPLVKKTELVLNEIWNKKNKYGIKYGDEFKYLFGLRLFQYAQGKHYDYKTKMLPKDLESRKKIIYAYRKTKYSSSGAKQFQRLSIGYNTLTYEFTPYRCKLSSEKANINYKNTANDHIIGATLCSQYVIYIFQEGKESEKKNWEELDWLNDRIDYMCNVWLKNNLWLWVQCRITKDEHNHAKTDLPENGGVQRKFSGNTLEDIMYKANLLHYEAANVKVCPYKNIR